jgi:shikimate kinase
MKYFICGFMGAGKSTALEHLKTDSSFFGYSFYDLDFEVAKKFNKDVSELGQLITDNGFDWFRKVEFEMFEDILNSEEKVWISLGGGSLTNTKFFNLAKTIKGYWLDTDFDTCLKRINGDLNRPLASLSKNELEHLYATRVLSYEIFEPFPYCVAK